MEPTAHLTLKTGLPFFCQMKLWILTSTVSPVSQDTSRTLPPPQPAVNPIPGERTSSHIPHHHLQEAQGLSSSSILDSIPTMCSWSWTPRGAGRAHSLVSPQM